MILDLLEYKKGNREEREAMLEETSMRFNNELNVAVVYKGRSIIVTEPDVLGFIAAIIEE
jgi:hypothetical protein